MRRLVPAVLLVLALVAPGRSEPLQSPEAAAHLAEQAMRRVVEGNMLAVFALLKPHTDLPPQEMDTVALRSVSAREGLDQRYGQTLGYALVWQEHAGTSLLKLVLLEKRTKTALPWTFHIPPNYVVECGIAHRKPPDVRIWTLRNQSCVGTRPPSTSTPHWPAC